LQKYAHKVRTGETFTAVLSVILPEPAKKRDLDGLANNLTLIIPPQQPENYCQYDAKREVFYFLCEKWHKLQPLNRFASF
jgi:hypothetical protein